jgi:hypothetical protein
LSSAAQQVSSMMPPLYRDGENPRSITRGPSTVMGTLFGLAANNASAQHPALGAAEPPPGRQGAVVSRASRMSAGSGNNEQLFSPARSVRVSPRATRAVAGAALPRQRTTMRMSRGDELAVPILDPHSAPRIARRAAGVSSSLVAPPLSAISRGDSLFRSDLPGMMVGDIEGDRQQHRQHQQQEELRGSHHHNETLLDINAMCDVFPKMRQHHEVMFSAWTLTFYCESKDHLMQLNEEYYSFRRSNSSISAFGIIFVFGIIFIATRGGLTHELYVDGGVLYNGVIPLLWTMTIISICAFVAVRLVILSDEHDVLAFLRVSRASNDCSICSSCLFVTFLPFAWLFVGFFGLIFFMRIGRVLCVYNDHCWPCSSIVYCRDIVILP